MSIIDKFKNFNKTTGGNQLNESEPLGLIDTVSFFDDDGICISRNGSVTVYRVIENSPLLYEDVKDQIRAGIKLDNMLIALQKTTSQIEGFMEEQSRLDRSIHFVTLQWEKSPDIPNPSEYTPEFNDYLGRTLELADSTERTILIGVELFPEAKTIKDMFSFKGQEASGDIGYESFMKPYLTDYIGVNEILEKLGTRRLKTPERNHFIAWHNHGENVDIPIWWGEKHAIVHSSKGKTRMKMYAVDSFEYSLQIPGQEIILNSMSAGAEEFPAICFIRTQLEPSRFTQKRAKKTIKNEEKQMQADREDGELPDEEIVEKYQGAHQLRKILQGDERPTLKETSIVYGVITPHDYIPTGETFKDKMENRLGVKVSELSGQQMEGFASTRPGGALELNPIPNIALRNFLTRYAQNDYSSSLIAFSGATLDGNIGDREGFLIGRNLPNLEPHYFDPFGSKKEGRSPAWLIMGEPGSGKSHLLKTLLLQCKLNNTGCVFIHPKRDRTLKSLAANNNLRFIDFNPSDKDSHGMLDPFLYITDDKGLASRLAANFLLETIFSELGSIAKTDFMNVFLKAANDPRVTCGWHALSFMTDIGDIPRDKILQTILTSIKEGGPAALVFSKPGMKKINFAGGEKNATIIHIDQEFDLDGDGAEALTNRALLKLMILESFYNLLDNGGGLFIADEAHAFLGDSEMVTRFSSIVRKGRSYAVTPIFASQRVSDLENAGFQPSRITMLMTKDEEEAKAGLRLAQMSEPFDKHIGFLKDCDYKPAKFDDSGALISTERLPKGIMMDLNLRHGQVVFGPHLPETLAALDDKDGLKGNDE